jgi:predicted RNA-binding protein YlqC (UPF0109 family)
MNKDLNLEELLLRMVKVLVDESDEVSVTSVIADNGTIFQVSVAPRDVGKVIGKSGRMARALRTLLSAIGVSRKTRYGLDIIANDDQH